MGDGQGHRAVSGDALARLSSMLVRLIALSNPRPRSFWMTSVSEPIFEKRYTATGETIVLHAPHGPA